MEERSEEGKKMEGNMKEMKDKENTRRIRPKKN